MNSRAVILTLLFLIISAVHGIDKDKQIKEEDAGFFTVMGNKLELKLGEYANVLTKGLAKFNDEHLGSSEVGKFFHYNEIKPKVEDAGKQSRSMKKLSLALIPLIFHVGAASTWMLVTTLLAAKSVALGIALLVFKIAVSSAKVASFFTLLKSKHHHEWTPHYEHHGHKRSLRDLDHPPALVDHPTYLDHPPSHENYHYAPEWTPNEKSMATYKASDPYTEYGSESKKVENVYGKN